MLAVQTTGEHAARPLWEYCTSATFTFHDRAGKTSDDVEQHIVCGWRLSE